MPLARCQFPLQSHSSWLRVLLQRQRQLQRLRLPQSHSALAEEAATTTTTAASSSSSILRVILDRGRIYGFSRRAQNCAPAENWNTLFWSIQSLGNNNNDDNANSSFAPLHSTTCQRFTGRALNLARQVCSGIRGILSMGLHNLMFQLRVDRVFAPLAHWLQSPWWILSTGRRRAADIRPNVKPRLGLSGEHLTVFQVRNLFGVFALDCGDFLISWSWNLSLTLAASFAASTFFHSSSLASSLAGDAEAPLSAAYAHWPLDRKKYKTISGHLAKVKELQ